MDSNKVVELFGIPTASPKTAWDNIVKKQWCPFTNTKCFKVRKSNPRISIGTCTVCYGKEHRKVIICPNRLLERKQVFVDCIHLLSLHEPGNELHIVSEISIPGGSIDFFLVSARKGKVKDFVAIEFQTLDSTGTIWPERQRLLKEKGLRVSSLDIKSDKGFGMNWKMTAKTILVQLHHKIHTFENLNKHMVLVVQDHLLEYMHREFRFEHLKDARLGDPMHIHSYSLSPAGTGNQLELTDRLGTDSDGIAMCLGLQAEAKMDLEVIIAELEKKLSADTILEIGPKPLAPIEQLPTE